MIGYAANKQGDKLENITQMVLQLTATEAQNEFAVNAIGDYFYFASGKVKALYEIIRRIDNGTVVKKIDDKQIINTFSEAILFGTTEAVIIQPAQANDPIISADTQEQVKEQIAEKIIIQPIVQPIQMQNGELISPQFQSITGDPQFTEIATRAETWVWQNIAQAVADKGVKVYNDNIPESEVRPREYVVISVDDEIRDIGFADNQNQNEESFVTLIIQGYGNTFENWVVEISNFIHKLLRGFREKGKIHGLTNRNMGFDETTKILSRSISFWLQYKS